MNWRDYQAKRAASIAAEVSVPCIEDITLDVLRKQVYAIKREDLSSMVAARTGIFLVDVMANINTILRRLEKQGKVTRPVHGFWRAT